MLEFNDAFEPLDTCPVSYGQIWLDPQRNLYAILDVVDLAWAQQWLWHAVPCKSGPNRIVKWYARRGAEVNTGGGSRKQFHIWLHKEILLRAKGPARLKSATIGDHLNGRSLDCRRDNLDWATHSENRRNLYGSATHRLKLGFKRVEARHAA